MKINVSPSQVDHFWDEPETGNAEFWAFRFPVKAKVNDLIEFYIDKKKVAESIIHRIEKPGESACDTTGKFKNRWKVIWLNKDFKDLRGEDGIDQIADNME